MGDCGLTGEAPRKMLKKPSFVVRISLFAVRIIVCLRDTFHEGRFTVFQLASVDHRQLAQTFCFLLDA